jgi:hypothetical protein
MESKMNQGIYLSIQEATDLKNFYLTHNGKIIREKEIFTKEYEDTRIIVNAKGMGGSGKIREIRKKLMADRIENTDKQSLNSAIRIEKIKKMEKEKME